MAYLSAFIPKLGSNASLIIPTTTGAKPIPNILEINKANAMTLARESGGLKLWISDIAGPETAPITRLPTHSIAMDN